MRDLESAKRDNGFIATDNTPLSPIYVLRDEQTEE